MQEALNNRFVRTSVDPFYKWEGCPACGTQRIEIAPQTFVVQLKRFVNTCPSISKLSYNVQATKTVSIQGHTYELCSAVVHRGSLHAGHYWAMTRDQSQGNLRWYTVNGHQKLPTTEIEWAQPYDLHGAGQFYMLVYTIKS